jgi:plastocyanin
VAESKWKIQPAYPIWLDVGSANEAQGGYPVFNVQRGFGDPVTKTCTWPAQNCSAVDPMGQQSPNNGTPTPSLDGSYFTFPAAGEDVAGISSFQGGTLVAVGGHLHPGGISDDIDLVRGTESRRIFTSVGHYWDRVDNTKDGGPPTSWDLSMTLTSLPRWAIDVKPGDRIRINATYDTSHQSTYEDMGIAIAYIAPHDATGKPTAAGLDPFAPDAQFNHTDTDPAKCLGAGVICTLGTVTHGHMAEAGNFGRSDGATALSAMPKQVTDTVHIGGFVYTPGDLTTISFTGIPTVGLGNKLEFVNEDMAIDVYHTATSCQYPCTGPTGTAFPLANESRVDFDSAELGYSPSFGPAKNSLTWDLDVTEANGFAAGQRYTYFCRIHPFMRGAFEVTG